MIRTASDQIVLQPSARTLCLCVGRASGPRSVDMHDLEKIYYVSIDTDGFDRVRALGCSTI